MQLTEPQAALVAAVRERVGAAAVVTDPDLIAPWLTDWRGKYHGASAAMLSPGSTGEVAVIVSLAVAHGVPLVPQGGNSSMVGGATPPADGSALILSLRRLNRVRSVDPHANLAVAEAGVILSELHDAALAAGRRFPLSLGAKGNATVGGLVATNAGGTQVLRFGTMRTLVAGVEAVLPDGSIHDGLAALKKDNRGYDLDHLLIGSEGTLAIVTAATLRLVPAISARAVAWVGVADPHAALALLRRIEAATDAVESFELIAADTLALALALPRDARAPLDAPAPWNVLIEAVAHGEGDEAPAALIERLLAAAFAQGLILDATIAASEAQAEAFWRIRDSLSDAERSAGPATQHDISVPVDALPRFLDEAGPAIVARFPGTVPAAFGHLGDGNLHFHVRAAERAGPGWEAEAVAVTRFVHDLVVAAGGSISAEHGIGQMKRDELERLSSPARMAALRAVKRGIDPAGLLNPGKLVSA